MTRHGDATYVFAVSLGNGPTRGSFTLPMLGENSTVEVLNEKRQVSLRAGMFRDDFGPYAVHLYRISAK